MLNEAIYLGEVWVIMLTVRAPVLICCQWLDTIICDCKIKMILYKLSPTIIMKFIPLFLLIFVSEN